MQRKEIYVNVSNLSPKHELAALKELATTFPTLSEQQQREVFTSIKIGEAKSLAKIELLRYEHDPSKHQKMAAHTEDTAVYRGLLKLIVPKDF